MPPADRAHRYYEQEAKKLAKYNQDNFDNILVESLLTPQPSPTPRLPRHFRQSVYARLNKKGEFKVTNFADRVNKEPTHIINVQGLTKNHKDHIIDIFPHAELSYLGTHPKKSKPIVSSLLKPLSNHEMSNQGLGGNWMTDLLGALPNPGAPTTNSTPGPQPPHQPQNHAPNTGPQPPAPGAQQIDVTTLLGLIAALNAGNAMTGAAAGTVRTGRVKIREPEVYDGKKRGRAVAWVEPILIDNLGSQNDPESYDWDDFKKAVEGAFGDTDRERTVIRELEALKQGKRPVSTYTSDFRRIKADIPNWDESTFVHYYRKGLNKDIKDYLVTQPVQTRLNALIELSIRIDNRIWERKKEKEESGTH
ncbi:hypothetical protein FRC04_005968 [Tulasnella sp. 424]|nr:hypothetical protein FRC04_005968 [Tulasnella sp. 424]